MSKPLHRTRSRLAIAALTAVLFAAGCPDNTPTPSARHWQVVARDLPEAVLSVAGTSATNVWAVGADLGAGVDIHLNRVKIGLGFDYLLNFNKIVDHTSTNGVTTRLTDHTWLLNAQVGYRF